MARKSNSIEDRTSRSTKKTNHTESQQKYGKYTVKKVRLSSHKRGQVVPGGVYNLQNKFKTNGGNGGRTFIIGKTE